MARQNSLKRLASKLKMNEAKRRNRRSDAAYEKKTEMPDVRETRKALAVEALRSLRGKCIKMGAFNHY